MYDGEPQKLVKRYPYKRITPEQWDMIKFYYRLGYSVRMIGRAYGYHESNIIAKAKKESWVFNDLGRLVNQVSTQLCNLISSVESWLKGYLPVKHWYIVLKIINTETMSKGNTRVFVYNIGDEIKVHPYDNGGVVPSKFLPTKQEILQHQKRLKRQKVNSKS
jgi:hypothetical protein